jgi:DNA-3-methyladenine glycosylase
MERLADSGKKLGKDFYTDPDVVGIARELLGKILWSNIDGELTGGMILETEAYAGADDRASHAWGNRQTGRTEVMFREGGCAYIYLCYGMHSLFNVVTGPEGVPHAVLIRGVEIAGGCASVQRRLGKQRWQTRDTTGPGRVTRALGVHYSMTGASLLGPNIWIEDAGILIADHQIITGPRIGVDYAGVDAALPYRFWVDKHAIITNHIIQKK